MSRNIDKAWECLDAEYHILDIVEKDSFAEISAQQMHEMRGKVEYATIKFEPRLLTHFDNSNQQPKLFKDNDLSIMPTSRGSYVVGHFNPFVEIGGDTDYDKIEEKLLYPKGDWDSLSEQMLFNETMGLNYAESHGILEDFVGESLNSTVAGRQSGGTWKYNVISNGEQATLSVDNPQIEIDGGYEGNNELVLVEAKNHLVSEFCLRQLYFPFRAWRERISKPIRTIFAVINGSDIYLYEYSFKDPETFEAELIKCCKYQIAVNRPTKEEVFKLFKNTSPKTEPAITFPQADSPSRTIDIIHRLVSSEPEDGLEMTATGISELYGIHRRQGNYYGDAAVYFGYAQKHGNGTSYEPTKHAAQFAELNTQKQKKMHICQSVFELPVFHDAFGYYVATGEEMPKKEIVKLISKYRNDLNEGTPARRSSTVSAWIKWIINLWE